MALEAMKVWDRLKQGLGCAPDPAQEAVRLIKEARRERAEFSKLQVLPRDAKPVRLLTRPRFGMEQRRTRVRGDHC